jgi:hypothetical protein
MQPTIIKKGKLVLKNSKDNESRASPEVAISVGKGKTDQDRDTA